MAGRKRWNHNSRTQPRNKEGRFFRPFSPSTSPSPSPSTSLSPSPSPSSSRLPSPSPSPSRDPYPTTVPGASPSNYKGKGPASSKVKKVMFFPYLQWNISSMLFPVYLAHAI
ncbi:hypothetical protein PVAP13_8KG169602 [Panicum virgatum]|uniref:Uncharacterized protein n=1 Tax=Panicum virgatum TaxID=38727 RepID=A0A8T0PN12_PANVG|nr:hypothetical protein PVAP13_8KG169602 [Panicum virgatum]